MNFKTPLISIFILLFFLCNANSQNVNIQSQLKAFHLEGIDSDLSEKSTNFLIGQWNDLNINHHGIMYDYLPAHKWQTLFQQRYVKAINDKDTALQFKIAYPLSSVLHTQSKFIEGIPVLEYLYANKYKFDKKALGNILIKLEEEYRSVNNIKKVIEIRNERIERGYIKTYWEIYYSCGLYLEAIEDFKLFEPQAPIATKERMLYFVRLGDLFFDAQMIDSAEKYYKIGRKEADIYLQKTKLDKGKVEAHIIYWRGLFSGLLGNCFIEKGLYKDAIPYIKFNLINSNDGYRIGALLSLSNCQIHLGEVSQSKILLDSVAYYLTNATIHKAELSYYKIKSDYFQTTHQYDSSLKYLRSYNVLKEKMLNEILKNQSVLLLGKMEIANRRKELVVTKNELNQTIGFVDIQKNRLNISFIVLLVLLAFIFFVLIIYKQKAKSKKEIEAKNILLEKYAKLNFEKSKHNEQLVKELHHRVKNNLQNIYSLLNIQRRRINDPLSAEFFVSMQNRINAMAIVHESLYADDNIESINFEQYTKTLIEHIQLSYEREHHKLSIKYDIIPAEISLEKVILLGLIINETVSNVYKYAIADSDNVQLHISLDKTETQYRLIISDNGPGFDINNVNEKSLGLKLIQTMCLQLEADYTILNKVGVTHTLLFSI